MRRRESTGHSPLPWTPRKDIDLDVSAHNSERVSFRLPRFFLPSRVADALSRSHLIRLAGTALALGILSAACATKPALLDHNNTAKYTVVKNLEWAAPDDFPLTMDIYTPSSEQKVYPVLMIFHGGGWLLNDKSIMDQAAQYIATNGDYVVCNVNYRLLSDQGNTVTIDQIIEDVFGSVLWVQENIGRYQGDPARVAVTGDSAGGHLSAMIVNAGDRLDSRGYSAETLAFDPSYLPPGRTAEDLAAQGGITVQAAILSYGGFDLYQASLEGFESWQNPFWLFAGALPRGLFGAKFQPTSDASIYKGVSPLHNMPLLDQRALPPQLLTAGSEDYLVPPASVRSYLEQLQAAGHPATYWEYEGHNHAFLDSGRSVLLGSSFEQDAPEALDVMIDFLDQTFSTPEMVAPTR
jgi:acetyl esterase